MEEENSQTGFFSRSYRQLKFSMFEQVVLVAMLLVLVLTGLDALEGQQLGKNNKLTLAKLQGQHELMASTFKQN